MKGFVIGRVCEPESRIALVQGQNVNILSFGLLVGRMSYNMDVFANDEIYPRAMQLRDGDRILAVVTSYYKEGRARNVLNAFCEEPDGLGEQLRSLVTAG